MKITFDEVVRTLSVEDIEFKEFEFFKIEELFLKLLEKFMFAIFLDKFSQFGKVLKFCEKILFAHGENL